MRISAYTKTHSKDKTMEKKIDWTKETKESLISMIEELECNLIELEARFAKGKSFKPGRKEEVLEVLMSKGKVAVADIAKAVGISARNVSSQLSYLRRDGYAIGTDSKGRKFIEAE